MNVTGVRLLFAGLQNVLLNILNSGSAPRGSDAVEPSDFVELTGFPAASQAAAPPLPTSPPAAEANSDEPPAQHIATGFSLPIPLQADTVLPPGGNSLPQQPEVTVPVEARPRHANLFEALQLHLSPDAEQKSLLMPSARIADLIPVTSENTITTLLDAGKLLLSDTHIRFAASKSSQPVTSHAQFNLNPPLEMQSATAQLAPPKLPLSHNMGSTEWRAELTNNVVWLAGKGVQRATLTVHPEQLGPIEVRISVQHDEARVWFMTQHPVTRQTIEETLPRLQNQFSEQGLQLVDTQVSDQSERRAAQESPRWSHAQPRPEDTVNDQVDAPVRHRDYLVDDYA